jgi:hypothetical protein
MAFMPVTEATFQLAMLSLNVGWLMNCEAMVVTAAVFQPTMLPYVVVAVVGFVIHDVTAVSMLESMRHALLSLLHVGYAVRSVAPQSR